MKKNLIVIAIVAAAVAAIIVQQQQIRSLQAKLTSFQPEAAGHAPVPAVPAGNSDSRAAPPAVKTSDKLATPAASKTKSDTAVPATVAAAAEEKPGFADMMKSFGSMMTNSAMKEMIRQQSKFQIEREYARLFKYLGLTSEQTEVLNGILMDRQMVVLDSGLGFMAGGGALEERTAKKEGLKSMRESYDKKIAALLGADDYASFVQFEESAPERGQVEMFKSSLASLGEPLTEQQEYDLVNAMHEARVSSPEGAALFDQDELPSPEMFSSSGLTNMIAQMDRVNEAYAASATKILSPTQHAHYLKLLEQQRAMSAMGLQMAAQMFGGSSSSVSTRVNGQLPTGNR